MDKAKIDKMSGSFPVLMPSITTILTSSTDEQIAQTYELMQAIRKQELEDNDPEFQAAIGNDPSKQN
jgi:hypothetical protein